MVADQSTEGPVLADINGDGAPDVVTPTTFWLNAGFNGMVMLATAVKYGTGIPSTTPAAGDLDLNGRADIVEWTNNGLVALLSK